MSGAIDISPDPQALARRVADWLLAAAMAGSGVFRVSLSGGSTPRLLYEVLATPPYRDRFPWSRVHWFWGDERCVPHNDALSNFRMVNEALFAHVPVPAANIHPIPTEDLTPEAAAAAYARCLKAEYGADHLNADRPLFDVTLLGLGEDGHTASLFPDTAALGERVLWTAAVVGAKTEARVTLTYPAIESSHRVAFLIAGASKRQVFAAIRHEGCTLPAARVRPTGSLTWFVDRAAMGEE